MPPSSPSAPPTGTDAPPNAAAHRPDSGSRRRPRGVRARVAAAFAVAALLATAAACQPAEGDGKGRGPSPYTGRTAEGGQVLAVKFDNNARARPHTGLEQADLVYVEKVEGGQSRLMGVYSSSYPETLGPVRSVRESDLELLRQFDRPALAYSGVRSALERQVEASPNFALPPGKVPGAYFRQAGRTAPHNLFLRPAEALRAAPQASRPSDIGFRFGRAPGGGKPASEWTVRYSSASTSFTWSAEEGRWLASFDGTPAMDSGGGRLGAPTVVVQHVTMRPSDFRDVTGAVTPYIETVGRGEATVLRDGRAFETTWQRSSETAGTTFTRADGAPMPFDRGQVWIVYADR
ncbi:DUF3048 domain-containing protein [Streptomyces sp. 549]|uniref:DUF3048 domain-containing protein n=1 Tax=Streptomyces sp. 549 TaxID=3049076 RepID=UPI0024C23858|nr:DUF3048 domain-containing protein [Streptomyces sp. 549]MDK1472267.1 DUF3048 domain-containing protein [Streptomyces sp. 549]